MRSIASYVLLTARSDRLVWALPLLMLAAALCAGFLGSAAAVEGAEMTLGFAGFALRLIAVLGLALFACFQLRRAYDSREIESMLARPVSRAGFCTAWFLGLLVMAVLIALSAALVLGLTAHPALPWLLAWTVGLAGELAVLAAASLFFGLLLSSASAAALSVLGFYALARLAGTWAAIAAAGEAGDAAGGGIRAIAALVPRLDMLAASGWLVQGPPPPAVCGLLAAQVAVYAALLVGATIFDFRRKEI
jgi:hypothetical protein